MFLIYQLQNPSSARIMIRSPEHPDASLIVSLWHWRIPSHRQIIFASSSLLRTHRHVQDVTYNLYSRPRDSSTRHSCLCDPTTSLFTPHDEDISDISFLQRCKSIWQRLGYLYMGRCFLIDCTTEFLVQISLADVFKSWADGLRIPFWDIGVRLAKLPLNCPWTTFETYQPPQ